MSRIGKIKIYILLVLAVANLILYNGPASKTELVYLLLPGLLLGILGLPIILLFNTIILKRRYDKPSWNDKLFRRNKALSDYLFWSLFFLLMGLCISIKTAIKYNAFSEPGIMSFSFGIGIFIGVYLTYFIHTRKFNFT